LYLLEHSHRFKEFGGLYDSIIVDNAYGKYQKEWLKRKCTIPLKEYKNLIMKMKKKDLPIDVCFGLEICYFPEKEEYLKSVISNFEWDFLTGSIHWIDGWGFDHQKIKEVWEEKDTDIIYQKYYELMIKLVESKIFNILAHPDSIKCFNYYANNDLSHLYEKLALCLKENNVSAEYSNGLFINYNHSELGMNKELLKILIDNKVNIVTASDAHRPQDVGMYIKEANKILSEHCA
jgi:histidinol-phosphatase (PHP family)